MGRHRFSKELEYKVLCFTDAPSIVLTSFFSHKGISHLDLQISQRAFSNSWKMRRYNNKHTFRTPPKFFYSKESLRNNLVERRKLLYNLHLDLPRGREYRKLKCHVRQFLLRENPESLFVAFTLRTQFLRYVLLDLLEPAIEKTDSKLKLLKWIVDFRPLEKVEIPPHFRLLCAKLLYRERADSRIATEFLRRKIIKINMFQNAEEVKVLEFLLKSARQCDFDVRSIDPFLTCLTDVCIRDQLFLSCQSLLKYEDTAFYTEESYYKYQRLLRRHRGRPDHLDPAENRMDKLRLQRILQIIYIFRRQENEEFPVRSHALEALRLVWSSIPDSFVRLEEMYYAYEGLLDSNLIREAHSFYEEAIRQTVSSPQPRPLSQYCRCLIRKCLNQRKQWLPEWIKQLQLPPCIESFLNLERDYL